MAAASSFVTLEHNYGKTTHLCIFIPNTLYNDEISFYKFISCHKDLRKSFNIIVCLLLQKSAARLNWFKEGGIFTDVIFADFC